MVTDTREYDDGTEPDVFRRWCCDGRCKQGRDCPGIMPAEAATEIGQEEIESHAWQTTVIFAITLVAIFLLLALMVFG